ncbi:MAG: efflux RND transporter periplasmic adaptor subunit [Bradyrhizobiaceae bacterium]|nr:efflux RND transporter periplasmic adaptor subunit [Bradyrhizobiaceae bacterium]
MNKSEPPPANSTRPREKLDIESVLGPAASAGRRSWRTPIWAAAVIVAAVLAAALWYRSGAQSSVRYVTEPAARGNLTVIVTATGSAQPTNKVEVSSELSGTIREVLVDYNSAVVAGDVLAKLDTDKLTATAESSRAKVTAAKAKVTETAATIEEKRADYERKKLLSARQITSAQELEVAKAAYDRAVAAHENALAEVGVAEADLRVNEMNLKKACICSPINGVVLERNVDPGQTVAVSLQAPVLFTIAEDLKQMELQVDVDEADVGKTKVGQQATFTVDAYPDQKFAAEVREIRFASEIVQGVVTYKALLTIDNSDLLIRPGMTATAEIIVNEVKDALLVPNAALRFTPASAQPAQRSVGLLERLLPRPPVATFRAPSAPEGSGNKRTIWTLKNGAPEAVAVTIGDTDGRRTAILSGELQPDMPVILDSTTTQQ